MNIPPSPHFTPLDLTHAVNADRERLPEAVRLKHSGDLWFGPRICQGIHFQLGEKGRANVIFIDREPVTIDVDWVQATYLLFLHTVADRQSELPADLTDVPGVPHPTGNEVGASVADYCLEYEDGSTVTTTIRRRFEIQQAHSGWGASAFAALPALGPSVVLAATEAIQLGRLPEATYGQSETRHQAGRDRSLEHLWLYALANPHPERRIRRVRCLPRGEPVVIYALTHTQLVDHPLRAARRQKLKLQLPEGSTLNRIGELDAIAIDLGTVISARAALAYDPDRWAGNAIDVQPERSSNAVIVEYSAHPQARLYVAADGNPAALTEIDLAQVAQSPSVVRVGTAERPVQLRIVERATGEPVAVRLHLHGADGEYLPPRGYHRKVNAGWFEDNYGEFVNGLNQYCYIPGTCVVDLPLGEVFIEVTRGYEVRPLRSQFVVTETTEEVTFTLDRVLDWRARGWVTADTHVHFLSPQTARLEAAAEDVNVVNLLASQWGEMFSNVGDFDGQTTIGAGSDYLVRVGTENRMQVLGHISLLGYSGALIDPLCTGGPSESALGDVLALSMAEWARRCIAQNGLVVMPHAPNPQAERAADIVLGLVHAIEMMSFNPFDAQISPYGIADWYRFLNLGYQIPVVGGSDKMSAGMLLGGMRTYAHLGARAFSYDAWMQAVKAGNTFVTVGPLVTFDVEGVIAGQQLHLPATGGHVNVSWQVESAMLPVERVELVVGGLAVEATEVGGLAASGQSVLNITDSTWIAVRVRGSYHGRSGELAAHTSVVQVLVGDRPIFSPTEAGAVLQQIEGAIAYVDLLAPRPDAQRYKQIRLALESAHNRLHNRLHRNGVFHQHGPEHWH